MKKVRKPMTEYKTVNEVYNNWLSSGIFSDLQNYEVPWKNKNINHELDIAYHGNHSGDKITSVIIDKFIDPDGSISQENRDKIASSIFTIYGDNWNHLWNTTIQEYNLLDNTDAYITETTNTEQNTNTENNGTDSGTVTHVITGDDTTRNTGTVTTGGTSTENSSNSNSIYGFNSESGSNSDSQTHTGNTNVNQTETRDTTDTLTHNTTDTETRDLKSGQIGSEKMTGTITHETHKHGNIGVTTNQQMIEEERKLWAWYFYNYIFEDVDKFLTISIY
jgi:hypothetical protein